ncbi:MAG: MFS transporter [Armatimonadota bacterium]|nr:MFS transporter [Armatimonadota bacterium]
MNAHGSSETYHRQKLFVASCIALVTTAMAFSIRADILKELGVAFDISHEQQGIVNLMGIWGFPIAILIVGPLCNIIGMGRLLKLACIGHILGVAFTILSPQFGFPILLASTLLIGLANGTVEAVINPLAATMYPEDKTHKLNVLHAWWPGGLVIGGLLTAALAELFQAGWQVRYGMIIIPALIYGAMIWTEKFPPTERAASGVSTADMFKEILRPGVLLLMLCMCMTAITELGPDQWVGSVLTDTVGIRGILFLVYTAGLMFVLRLFAGPLARFFTPVGLLAICAVLAAAGLYWLSYSFTAGAAFAAATVFGIGKAYFWPTMLGITSERYPRGGEFLLAVMGATGMIAAGVAGPTMGRIYDHHTIQHLTPEIRQVVVVDGKFSPEKSQEIIQKAEQGDATAAEQAKVIKEALRQGAAMTFRYVAILPVILVVLFGLQFLYYRSIGGYRAIQLEGGGGSGH